MILAADVVQPTTFELVLQYVVAPAIPLICAGVLGALAKVATYLHAKEGESKAARVGAVVADAARSVVAELEVTLKPQLQAAFADGKLTEAEKAQLKTAALEALKTRLPPAVMESARDVFGGLLDTWLGGLVERAVAEQKTVPPSP